jgi:hypothetical protein
MSRLGPGDYHCHEGQARIATETLRDRHDRVIVTEKLDGSNVAVANVGGEIFPLTRAAIDPVEGAVWRVERRGKFDFMAKFVRHDKSDGKYLASVTGGDPVPLAVVWK